MSPVRWSRGPFAALFVLGFFLGCGDNATPPRPSTPLDEYVAAPEPAAFFDSTPKAEEDFGTATGKVYRLVSQEWLTTAEVDRPLWEHWLLVYEPKETASTTALIIVSGGSYNANPPTPSSDLGMASWLTGSVIAEIKQIPNQPLRFVAPDGSGYIDDGRKEDSLIAYGWSRFLSTGDPEWLAQLAMTKSVVRAMDAIQQLRPDIQQFFVLGASKRGWTTWLTGAVDERVIGIAPAVIDCLNLVASFDNHLAVYGTYAPAVKPYVDEGIMDRMHTPEFATLASIIDPFVYRERLTMPKYIVNSTGDQFFTPDSWEFYFADLVGEKYLRYVPNTAHNLEEEIIYDAMSFYHAVINGTPRPEFDWRREADGSLTVRCETAPSQVKVWRAENPDARDFRLETLGDVWVSEPLAADADGAYRAKAQLPAKGWAALLVELEFPNPNFGYPFKFTTGVSIVPDTRPYASGK